MSCGNPHETPCSEVLETVYLYLDAECDQTNKARIRQHLDECSPCLQEFGIEQEVKELVGRCCGQETAPAGLRDRLKAKLREAIAVEVTAVEVTAVDITALSAEPRDA